MSNPEFISPSKFSKSIMESIKKLSNEITIIVVAHRLKTIKYCNRVIKLEKGQIVADGDPTELIKYIE